MWIKCEVNSASKIFNGRGMPYIGVVFLQLGFAGIAIIAKFGLNNGMSHYTFAVYRNLVAGLVFAPFALFLERKQRPPMTLSIFFKIMLLGLLEPVLDQNLYYAGMEYTTASFATSMVNAIPAVTFVMAWIFRLEKVNLRRIHSQAKIVGTLVTVGGAMIMTLVNGTTVRLPWTKVEENVESIPTNANSQHPVKGGIMISAGCICWGSFYILQAFALKSYPAGLSLTSLVCLAGALQGAILTFIIEKGKKSIWTLRWDMKLLSAVYGGVICSGLSYYISGIIMQRKGPVFVTAFNPLSMVLVVILGSLFQSEQVYMGRIIGAGVIVSGLYLVLWGKSKEKNNPTMVTDQSKPLDQDINNEV